MFAVLSHEPFFLKSSIKDNCQGPKYASLCKRNSLFRKQFSTWSQNSKMSLEMIELICTQNFSKNQYFLPLIRTRTRAYQRVRNVSFSENFAYVLNECPLFQVSVELVKILLHLQDQYNITNFYRVRMNAMVTITVRSPKQVS